MLFCVQIHWATTTSISLSETKPNFFSKPPGLFKLDNIKQFASGALLRKSHSKGSGLAPPLVFTFPQTHRNLPLLPGRCTVHSASLLSRTARRTNGYWFSMFISLVAVLCFVVLFLLLFCFDFTKIDLSVFSPLDILRPRHRASVTRSETQLRMKYLSVMISKCTMILFIKGMLMKYLVHTTVTFITDKMMFFLPEGQLNHKLMMFIKQGCTFAIKSILKFVIRKIAAVTESLFVELVKIIASVFKKNLREPICTNEVWEKKRYKYMEKDGPFWVNNIYAFRDESRLTYTID